MQKIDELIKIEMKNRNPIMLKAFRAVKAKIMLEKTKKKPSSISEEDLFLQSTNKEIKERIEANSYFKDDSHPDLKENNIIIKGLTKFLPSKLSKDDQLNFIKKIITTAKANSIKDIGSIMQKLAPHKLLLDMKLASQQVRDILT
ncbi:MAG: GatB/YqeY domain-containing protein [SAR324 cluster bacterium]|nr:GatB/YqeY domain-containing protein [SAR324 cluster bacterium]